MSKQDEIDFLNRAGEGALEHALNKPYSDDNCAQYLIAVGAVMSLLPPPPARLLDMGCGTGWTSCFFAQRGYNVVGLDISSDMIRCAQINKRRYGLDNLAFVVSDYENRCLNEAFDCAVFYDSLHHSENEEDALAAVYQALRPHGVCVASEPGHGHTKNPHTRENVERYGVPERDMPPSKIIRAAKKVGFSDFRLYPHTDNLVSQIYRNKHRTLIDNAIYLAKAGLLLTLLRKTRGITVLIK